MKLYGQHYRVPSKRKYAQSNREPWKPCWGIIPPNRCFHLNRPTVDEMFDVFLTDHSFDDTQLRYKKGDLGMTRIFAEL